MDKNALIAGEMSCTELDSSNAGNDSESDSEPEPHPLTITHLRQFIQENGIDMASTITEVESLVFLHASQTKKSLQLTKQHCRIASCP